MGKARKICRICGASYEACTPAYGTVYGVDRWQDVACCVEHGMEYFEMINASRRKQAEDAIVASEDERTDESISDESVDDTTNSNNAEESATKENADKEASAEESSCGEQNVDTPKPTRRSRKKKPATQNDG